jgi:hypothetical protein
MAEGTDLTARLNSLREVLHIEVAASESLLNARINGVDEQRQILLSGLNDRGDAFQAQLDRRLEHLQLQVDQRFESYRETLVALKEMLDERYATQTKALDAAFKAAEQAVAVALANAEKATVKAEMASDKRFEAVNEFRAVLGDQTKTFISRTEYETSKDALGDRIAAADTRVNALELRLTSRLDLDQGANAGGAQAVSEKRLDTGLLFQILAVVISLVAVVAVIVLRT